MKYINKEGAVYDGGVLLHDGQRIFNPTEEDLSAAGYEPCAPVVSQPSAVDVLEEAKSSKLKALDAYDSSEAVNSFTIGGQVMWLTVDERQQLATQISANEAVGRESMTRWFGGQEFTFPISAWKQMLVALEVYAGDAINVTESHKAAINNLNTIEEVEGYDFTAGYPARLLF